MAWSVKQLRKDVERLHGRDQARLLSACLQSIDERRGFARYHFAETKRLLESATAGRDEPKLVQWLLDSESDADTAFPWVRFRAAAHITACVQSMHSLSDILAHAVYFALGMNLDAATLLRPRAIALRSVCDKLPHNSIRAELSGLSDHAGYVYLSALANHSKHRSIVPVPFSVDLSGADTQPHGLKFGAFEFDSVQFQERWVNPTLTQEYDRQEAHVHVVGHALNAAVAAMLPP